MVQGKVDLINKIDLSVKLVRNRMDIDTSSKEYHYVLKSGDDSWAIITIDGKDIVLKPNSELSLTNSKLRSRLQPSFSKSVKTFAGKVWAGMGMEPEKDELTGGGGGGVRG
jgi:hypothetical protein